MPLEEQVYSVLVVSSAEKMNQAMTQVLPEARYHPITFVANIAAAQRAVAQRSFDFIVVNTPLPDDPGVRFAIDCSDAQKALVLLLVKGELLPELYEKVAAHGVFILQKPMSRQAMETALRWLITAKQRLRGAEKKSTKMEDKMEEIRLVNRAKWLLISKGGLLEPEAHRYIEKGAMDRCVSKRTVAEEIIRRYE